MPTRIYKTLLKNSVSETVMFISRKNEFTESDDDGYSPPGDHPKSSITGETVWPQVKILASVARVLIDVTHGAAGTRGTSGGGYDTVLHNPSGSRVANPSIFLGIIGRFLRDALYYG